MKSKKWIELFFKFWSFFSWAVLQVRVTPSKINGVCHDPAKPKYPLCSPVLSTEPGPRWTSPGGALGCSLLFPVPFQMLPITSLCVTTAEWRESCPWWGTVKHRALSAPLHSSNHIFLFPPRFPARASVGGVSPVCPVCWGSLGSALSLFPCRAEGWWSGDRCWGRLASPHACSSGFAASHSW